MLSPRQMQFEILTAAARRPSGFVLPLPRSMETLRESVADLLQELIAKEFVVERPVLPHEAFWLESVTSRTTVLVITGLGIRALAASPNGNVLHRSSDGKIDASALDLESATQLPPSLARSPEAGSKLDLMVSALRTLDGATVQELAKLTGWQTRSVRAALSSQLKARRGVHLQVIEQPGSPNRYKIR